MQARRGLFVLTRCILGTGQGSLLSAPGTAFTRQLTAQAQPSPEEEAAHTFRAQDLTIERSTVQQPPINLEDLKFGTVFTDHMFVAEHAVGRGWGAPAIKPLGLLQLHPASQVLHYGMCCFEGMKAYAGVDDRMRLFRPEQNMARLRRSARRLQLADFDPQELLACLKQLLLVDASWLPAREGFSIYIRPFAFSSCEPFLCVGWCIAEGRHCSAGAVHGGALGLLLFPCDTAPSLYACPFLSPLLSSLPFARLPVHSPCCRPA